jgi:hypothetical protein
MWGKYTAWPRTPHYTNPLGATVESFAATLQKVYAKWRAYKMVKSLSPEKKGEMKQKVEAYDIFHGKKTWDFARKFEADYLEMDSNPTKAKYVAGMQRLFSTYGDTSVLFADYGTDRLLMD